MPLLPQAIADAVKRDGLPRQAIADDDSVHVLYLDGARLRSVLAADWPPPLPTEPTDAQIAAAVAAREAADLQAKTDAAALRTRVRTTAQSAVGVVITDLTAVQVRALLAVLLWKAGALDKDGKVRPLGEWE
jgi:hypothetical protein